MSNARELAELGGSYGTGGFVGMKNRIINGAMMIDQRNAGASVTPDSAYTLDRWRFQNTQTGKATVQQNAASVTPPVGFSNYLGITSTSAYSLGSSDWFSLNQPIEGFNTSDLNWGTANAATVTVSFWVRSSLTGTFGGAITNSASNRSYPFSFAVNSANTWEQKTITIAGDTSGTWVGATNGIGAILRFSLGTGSSLSGTAGSWASGLYLSATGATSVVGTSGATFYITGVQLEKGSTATSFDYRPYGTELALCQRYYEASVVRGATSCYATASAFCPTVFFKQAMRSTPTLTFTLDEGRFDGGTSATATLAANEPNNHQTGIIASAISVGGVDNNNGYCTVSYTASAEL